MPKKFEEKSQPNNYSRGISRQKKVSVVRPPIFRKKRVFFNDVQLAFTSLHGYTSSQYFAVIFLLLGTLSSSNKLGS